MNVGTIAKSIVAGIIAGLSALATALQSDGVTALEWVTIALATLVAGYAVWQVPNTPKLGK